jgi:hypothetical protein
MFELLNSQKRRKSIGEFDIALDFAGQVGSQVIGNTGTGLATFTAQGAAAITDQAKVFGNTSLVLSGAATNFIRSLNAVPGGFVGKEFYIGFYARSRGNNTDPYRGFFHLGNRATSANGILLINDGLYIANPAASNWLVTSMAAPSTTVFEHFGIAKRRTASNDLYRLFRNGQIVGTQSLAIGQLVPGDDSAQLDIGINRAAGQTINSFIANFRMKIGDHVHWEPFNPADDYA